MDLFDNRVDSLARLNLSKQIEELIACYLPQEVYVHHAGDVNVDHCRLHDAVITVCRSTPLQPVWWLLSFEVPSSTEWQPPGSGPSSSQTGLTKPHWSRKRSFVGLCQ